MSFKNVALFVFALNVFSFLSQADEGMWTFNNLPSRYLKTHYNFEMTQAWADHVMKSSVRFDSGGSGSFVSSTGLVITNHHIGADTLQKISTANHDYFAEGFYASSMAQEVKSPDLELNQLVSIEDVTSRVNSSVKAGMDAGKAFLARRGEMAKIEKESFNTTHLRSDVVKLYNGGLYQLYRYKKYTDVRLVFAPEFRMAFFGGDPDNFEYPRYDLDICIFRAYENDKPAKIENFLTWSPEGTHENDLVFVSGNPGSTNRMDTVAALKMMRDVRLPLAIESVYRAEISLQQYMGGGPEQVRRAHEDLFGVQNSRKALLGRLQGLQDPKFMAEKEKSEKRLRSRLEGRADLKKYVKAWDKIEKAQSDYRKIILEYSILEKGRGFSSKLFQLARTLVRLADEDKKPNDQRLPEFRDSSRSSLEQALYSPAPIYSDLEVSELTDALSYFQEKLGGDNPLLMKILGSQSVVEKVQELVKETKLQNVAERKTLAKGGVTALLESSDPMIKLARLIDAPARKIRKEFEDKVDGINQDAYGQLASAKFALDGTDAYPDATFTPRLAYGVVKGYSENGAQVPAITTMGEAFQHEKDRGGKDPFLLPESWHLRMKNINLKTPFNFVSTADIIGGNSGSPLVDRMGHLVGLIFDGNIQSLPLQFGYTETQARAVSVSSNSIMESLIKIYNAKNLALELGH